MHLSRFNRVQGFFIVFVYVIKRDQKNEKLYSFRLSFGDVADAEETVILAWNEIMEKSPM